METIIRVHRPAISDEERIKRMKAIHEAAVKLVLAAQQSKREMKDG